MWAGLAGPAVAESEDPDGGGGILFTAFDIMPGDCPNLFTPFAGSPRGMVGFPAAIPGTDEVEPSSIQISSLLLTVPEGGGGLRTYTKIPPIQTEIIDVATAFVGPEPCDCTTGGPDQTLDLALMFDPLEVSNALGVVAPGTEVLMSVTGDLLDGTSFIGWDCVTILGPSAVEPSTWGEVKSRYH